MYPILRDTLTLSKSNFIDLDGFRDELRSEYNSNSELDNRMKTTIGSLICSTVIVELPIDHHPQYDVDEQSLTEERLHDHPYTADPTLFIDRILGYDPREKQSTQSEDDSPNDQYLDPSQLAQLFSKDPIPEDPSSAYMQGYYRGREEEAFRHEATDSKGSNANR